jgi:Flp pilus assembly protein TadD
MHPDQTARAQAEALYYTALDAIAAGNPGSAVAACEAALAVDPSFLDAMHALIRALQDAGELDRGIAVAHQLAALDPDDVLAYTSLSILYQRKGLVPEAEAAALKAKLLGWKQQLQAAKAPQGWP